METIFKRVSMRRYQDKAVEKEKLEKLVRAGMAAPSAGNQQPWEFYVVTRKDLLAELSNTSKYSICVKDAAAAIIPCFRTSAEALMFKECVQLDMSAATENILLEAVELGLGAVWLGVAPVFPLVIRLMKKKLKTGLIRRGYIIWNNVQKDVSLKRHWQLLKF